MEKQVIETIKSHLKPVFKKYEGIIKTAYIAGSATRKDYVEGSDIDMLFIVDDTKEGLDESVMGRMKFDLSQIAKKAMQEDRLDLHIQRPKPLSVFWDMIRSGQPWIITQMRDAIIIYDPSGFLAPMKKLLNQGKLSGTKERANALINEAPKKIVKARKIFIEDIMNDLLLSMVESAQAVLMFAGVAPPYAKNVGAELKKRFAGKDMMDTKLVDAYEEFYSITRKIDHGEITNVSGSEVERYMHNAECFIETMERIFLMLETSKKRDMIDKSYRSSIKTCSDAIEMVGRIPPKKDKTVLKHFRTHLIDTGLVSKEHMSNLEKIFRNKKVSDEGRSREIPENEVYSSNVYSSNLRNAVDDLDKEKEMKEGKRNA